MFIDIVIEFLKKFLVKMILHWSDKLNTVYLSTYTYIFCYWNKANGEFKSSKERQILEGKNHGRKSDFCVFSKIDDVNMKPLSNLTSRYNKVSGIHERIIRFYY